MHGQASVGRVTKGEEEEEDDDMKSVEKLFAELASARERLQHLPDKERREGALKS